MDNDYYSIILNHAKSLTTVYYYHYQPNVERSLKDLPIDFPFEYKVKLAGSHEEKWMRQKIKFSVKSYPV